MLNATNDDIGQCYAPHFEASLELNDWSTGVKDASNQLFWNNVSAVWFDDFPEIDVSTYEVLALAPAHIRGQYFEFICAP